jgi:pilus assembly protein CpaB
MGKWRAVIPIVLALMIAVVASYFIYKYVKKQVAPKEVAKMEEVSIRQAAIAMVELPAGTKLKPKMIKTIPFLEESLPPGSFSSPDNLVGRVVITPIKSKELILESRLAPADVTRGGVSAILKPGKRAISIKGTKVLGLSGLVKPGDRVDVLLITTNPKTKESINKTVFENVRILATGTELIENAEGKPSPVDNYTLEVTPEEGEKLVLASTHGKLQFALRNILDTETVLTTGATLPETLASYRPIVPTKKVKRKVPIGKCRKGCSLEIIRWTEKGVLKKGFK